MSIFKKGAYPVGNRAHLPFWRPGFEFRNSPRTLGQYLRPKDGYEVVRTGHTDFLVPQDSMQLPCQCWSADPEFFYRTMEKPNITSLLQFHSCRLQGTLSSPVYQPLGFGTTIIPVLLFLLIWAPSTFKLLCLAHPWPLSAVTELSLSLVQANSPHSAEMWLPPWSLPERLALNGHSLHSQDTLGIL